MPDKIVVNCQEYGFRTSETINVITEDGSVNSENVDLRRAGEWPKHFFLPVEEKDILFHKSDVVIKIAQ